MKYNRLASIIAVVTGLWVTTNSPGLAVSFNPPSDNASPSQGMGGASRSGFQFTPPSDNSIPPQSTGGASRGDIIFIPLPDNAAPPQSTGGASREGVFIPSPDNPTPTSSTGGASRTNEDLFTGSAVSMVAMTPPNFYGLTVSERPIFMAYLPASSAWQAIFRLKDEAQNIIYEQTFPLDGTAGILTVQLPETAPTLEVEQYYQWFVTLQSEDYLTPASPFANAWVKRVEPTSAIAQALESDNEMVVAQALAQAGIWYDTSAILASLQIRQSGSNETESEHWAELLSSVGLGDFAEAPLLSNTSTR